MAYLITDALIGMQDIAENSTTQKHQLGLRIRAYDATLGWGEFVYLKGVASTVVGHYVTYVEVTGVTTLALTRAKGVGAFAMAATVAAQFGWYQIWGCAVAKSNAAVAGSTVYVTAGAGVVDDAVVAGDIIYGATYATADGTPSAGLAEVTIHYPFSGDTDNI